MDWVYSSPKVTLKKMDNNPQNEQKVNNQRQAPLTPNKRINWSPQDFNIRELRDINALPMPRQLMMTGSQSTPSMDMIIVETPKNKVRYDYLDQINEEIKKQITQKIIWEKVDSSNEECSSESNDQYQIQSENSQQPSKAQQQQVVIQPQDKNELKRQSSPSFDTYLNQQKVGLKKLPCNCSKSRCLKLYCDCFRMRLSCDGCNCIDCHNVPEYNKERQEIIDKIQKSNPNAFNPKIESQKHMKGCSCRKSNCLKKYCECYQAGLRCGINCKCLNCKNVKENNSKDKTTAKKIRHMVEI